MESSVRPKPGFGISNRNQEQVSVSVLGPELFLPKHKLSRILPKIQFSYDLKNKEQHLDSQDDTDIKNPKRISCYKWSLEVISNFFITD